MSRAAAYPLLLTRREALRSFAVCAAAMHAGAVAAAQHIVSPVDRGNGGKTMTFRYALNAATIRGYKLPIEQQIDVCAQAGFDAIEPWLSDVDAFVAAGGHLSDLRRQLDDGGLEVAGAIAFWKWADRDPGVRRQSLELARREMATIGAIGGTCAAAPPFGDLNGMDLDAIAACYAALCEVGQDAGVDPCLELWGHAPMLSTLAQVLYVAAASGREDASILLDIYHLYKGGNRFESLHLVDGAALALLHINDYPATPPRETIGDQHRVWPGDGVAPIADVTRTLKAIGYKGFLSLELFNTSYWTTDALTTARTGLQKAKQAFETV